MCSSNQKKQEKNEKNKEKKQKTRKIEKKEKKKKDREDEGMTLGTKIKHPYLAHIKTRRVLGYPVR